MDYLLPLWLRQYLVQRQKREIPEDVADHLLHICAQALSQRDPVTLSQPRAHSIHQSFLLILQQPTVAPSSTTRSKFPFASTASAYKRLKARDLDPLKSQEVVRMAIYIMKRSRLEFADPYTCERVHTEGEKSLRQPRTRVIGHADPSSQQLQREPTAAQVYSSKGFHIGDSVLHNRSYPMTRHVESLIVIAAFCARASVLRRRSRTEGASIGVVSPTASALDMASASIAGSKWLAKLGQIMFGGVCAQAGHTHHRRTRASLELLEQQNIELGQKILAEQQQQEQRRQKRQGQASSPTSKTLVDAESVLSSHASQAEELKPSEPGLIPSSIPLRSPGPGSLSHSTSTSALSLSMVSTGTTHLGANNASTSPSTSTSTPLNDKWCRHCSRAMSSLVIIAVQESNGSLVGGEDLGVSLEDTGLTSSAMDTLNVIHSLSSSTSSLNDSPVDRRTRRDPASDLSRRQHDTSSSPYILFSRSHDPDDDMIRSSTGPAVKASSTLSESLADAFGSELASAGGCSDKPPTRGHSSNSGSSSGRSSNNNNRIKKIITAGLQRPTTDESDLELVSRTGSGLPSTGMSMESSCTVSTRAGSGSWQETSPAVQESMSKVQSGRNSPRPIPTTTTTTTTTTRASSAGTTPSSSSSGTRRLEMDLAEAATTPSPGSVSSFSRLPATAIGIQPSLESLASASSFSRRRSQASSRRLSIEEGLLEQDAATATATARVEEATKVASSSTGLSHSSEGDSLAAAADESSSQSLSRSSSSRTNKLQSSSSQESSISSSNNDNTSSGSSPSHLAIIVSREVTRQDSQDEVEERAAAAAAAAAPLEHHSFYALGIHGQTSTESYAREIEESMSRPPPTESSRSKPSSTSSSTRALEKSGLDHEGASDDDDVGDVEDAEDATESAGEPHETAAVAGSAAATRHLDKDDSGSRETQLGSDSESEDETSSPQMPLAPPSKKEVSSPQGSSEAEQDDNNNDESEDESEDEDEDESENENGSEQGLDVQQESSPSLSSLVTRPLSTASSSTLLTDDSFLSSLGSSNTTHERGHGYDGDDDDEEEEGHGGDGEEDEDEDGEHSPRLDSSFALSGSDGQLLTREERKQEQKRLQRRKRRLLVDDAKRKQEQLDRIKAQLELKDLGKIRQQVSFWEEKGVLEQKVVAMVEVEEEEEEEEKKPEEAEKKHLSSKDEISSSGGQHREHDARDKTVVIQGKMADVMLGEPLSPGNNQLSGYDEPPKPAARTQQGGPSSESDLAVFLSDID